jgi:integrase
LKYYPIGRGKAVRESAGTSSEKEARRMLRARLKESAGSSFIGKAEDRITFDDLFAEIEADYQSNNRRSIGSLYTRKKPLRGFFGRMRAIEIKPSHIAEYKRSRFADGIANGTINRELACLKRMFKLGMVNGLITSSPHITMLEEAPPGRIPDQGRLPDRTATSAGDLADFAGFLFRSGWRVGEARKLRWSDVDLDAGEITLRAANSKNKRARVLILDGEIRQVIGRALKKQRPGMPVFWMDRYHRTGEKVRNRLVGLTKFGSGLAARLDFLACSSTTSAAARFGTIPGPGRQKRS